MKFLIGSILNDSNFMGNRMKRAWYRILNCPIHKLEMYYHPPSKQYACQNPDCRYAHGISGEELINDPNFMGN